MICPYCKNENSEGANICSYCGFSLTNKNQLSNNEEPPVKEQVNPAPPQVNEEHEALFEEPETLMQPEIVEIQNGPQYHPANNPQYNQDYTVILDTNEVNNMAQMQNNTPQPVINEPKPSKKSKPIKQPKPKKVKKKKTNKLFFLFLIVVVLILGSASIYILITKDYTLSEVRSYIKDKINKTSSSDKEPVEEKENENIPADKKRFNRLYYVIPDGFSLEKNLDTSIEINKTLENEEKCLITMTRTQIQVETNPKYYYTEYLGYSGTFTKKTINNQEFEAVETSESDNYDRIATIFEKEGYEISLYNKNTCKAEYELFLNSIEFQ